MDTTAPVGSGIQKRSQWKQWAACLSATLSMVSVGTVYGWTTTTIPHLTGNSSTHNGEVPLHLTSDESSWVISITAIGSMLGPFYGVYVAATLGRRPCLLQTSLFYTLGWLLVTFAQNAWHLYAARVILGFGVGMSYTASPMYVSEVVDVGIRGAVGSLVAVNVFTGSLLACSVGPYTSYHVLVYVLMAVPVLFVATFVWFPESPYWLATQGRDEEAKKAIGFFKGIDEPSELAEELADVRYDMGEDTGHLEFSFANVHLLLEPTNRRALLIVMVLVLGQQLSGNFSTMQYLEQMFGDAGIGIGPDVATIIVSGVGLASGVASALCVERTGRRPLLLAASLGCAIALGVLGAYLSLRGEGVDVSAANLLPVVDVVVYQVVYQMGLGTMAYLLIGELFPVNAKGVAGAVVTIFDGLLEFAVTKMYEVVFSTVGSRVVYVFFTVSCFALFGFVYGFVPETKGKTFHEIRDILGEWRPFRASKAKGKDTLAMK
ncbi:facilitated trehalose transporter Tret1-like [Copidosoma floridanum]|nr:facilitated trehalose transporter Tret1-like [Copidosoma floridanum]XP_023245045.1 facilitated trehalose transporter Tret1-like [Copidosoma floridanum]XP_023245046.1 facilitated trehalose transporter Tret1-like [Copidosoma floridanum]